MSLTAPPWKWRALCALACVAVPVVGVVACGKADVRARGFIDQDAEGLFPDAGGDGGLPLCPSDGCLPFHLDCNGDAGDGCEVNTRTDLNNCGGCGISCENDGGAPPFTSLACVDGKCTYICLNTQSYGPMRNCRGDNPIIGDPIRGCPDQLLCNALHCGSCGTVAPKDSLGDRLCINGQPVGACPAGLTNCQVGTCGAQCKDLTRDPQNCGACGRACPDPSIPGATVGALAAKHITFTCGGPKAGGAMPDCVPSCASDETHQWKDCDGDFEKTVADPSNPAYNGCELDTFHNKDNCGACGNTCKEVCHTKPSSTTFEQVCDCPPGLMWCNNACVDTANDPRNCGSCGAKCLGPWTGGNGTPVCVESQCSFKCNAGFADCNKQLPDGCEVNTENFPDHCGSCGHQCAPNQRCGNGVCQVKDCVEDIR